MTEETPGKVLSLLAIACSTLLMLFLVSYSNMSFNSSEVALSDPFAPKKVVAVIDNATAYYSQFLAANLINPARANYAYVSESVSWVWQESQPSLARALGLSPLPPPPGQVAGAFISSQPIPSYHYQGLEVNMDTLYALLIR